MCVADKSGESPPCDKVIDCGAVEHAVHRARSMLSKGGSTRSLAKVVSTKVGISIEPTSTNEPASCCRRAQAQSVCSHAERVAPPTLPIPVAAPRARQKHGPRQLRQRPFYSRFALARAKLRQRPRRLRQSASVHWHTAGAFGTCAPARNTTARAAPNGSIWRFRARAALEMDRGSDVRCSCRSP